MYVRYKYAIRLTVAWVVIYGLGVTAWIDPVHDWLIRHDRWSWVVQAWLALFAGYLIFVVVTVCQAWRAPRSEDA